MTLTFDLETWFLFATDCLAMMIICAKLLLNPTMYGKAFDKVSHLKLLYKLSTFGITGKTLNWIEAFLISCSQTVVLDGESSDEVPVTSRVPYLAHSFFFCILMTFLKTLSHKLGSLQMTPWFT